jgi:hypothetical protein
MHIIPHDLLSYELCELTLAVSHPPTGEEHVVKEETPNNEAFDLI